MSRFGGSQGILRVEDQRLLTGQGRFADDLTLQTALLASIRAGLAQRGVSDVSPLRGWAEELAGKLLDASADDSLAWTNSPPAKRPDAGDPWEVQRRASGDGNQDGAFFSSLPRGEQGGAAAEP